jgi:hypothetical protein
MSTQDDAFFAEAKSLNYTFRAKAGTKPTWTPRWGFVTDEPRFDPRFKIGGQFGGWFYGVRAYGGHGLDLGATAEATRGPAVNNYSDFAGVLGTGVYVTGVAGTSINNIGVYGQTGEVPNSSISQVLRAGVLGASNTDFGVFGWSTRSAGLLGFSNNIGVYGVGTNYAGLFEGNLLVVGGTKAAAVPFPDGTRRVLYCMESPELWFEDFGTAKLKRGRVVVKLDADFAKVIKRGDYRVFFTPEGDCRGLYVRRKANSFEVRELMGGKSAIAFSYRIVGRRKDVKEYRRFAKVDTRLPMPAAKAGPPRKPATTAAELHTFLACVEKEARERRPKGMKKGSGSRPLPKYVRPGMRP